MPTVAHSLEQNPDFMVVTTAAQSHFRSLLQKEDLPGMNLRMFVAHPGTAYAEVSITFCKAGEERADDIPICFEDYILFVEKTSKLALEAANIDFKEDALGGGQLCIKAPSLKGNVPTSGASLGERVQYVIDTEINPSLASHGGHVSIVAIERVEGNLGNIIVLQFGGGCHGCGMSGVTLKQGIEKSLKEKFPEILEIRDATDHTTGANPYYS